jgi:hypothetical protein
MVLNKHRQPLRVYRRQLLALSAVAGISLSGPATAQTSENSALPPSASLACDIETITAAMAEQTDTEVLLVRSFEQGEALLLDGSGDTSASAGVEGAGNATIPVAGVDTCLVKLLVEPGNPGPADAPSTSAGIGIEVMLPAAQSWNERIRAYGNSGWSGSPQASLTAVAGDDIHAAAVAKGFVVATSDNGHAASVVDASFAMNPDGTTNTTLWHDFAERSLHELADKTKLLTKVYYGREHSFAYWDGFSTGGRQGLKLAQVYAEDFDGILVGSPAINWSRYHTSGLYPQLAMQRDLGYLIDPAKLSAATSAAIAACGGSELGFLVDPFACEYDPTLDQDILCDERDADPQACLTPAEASVINKIWYGQTIDGTAPSPADDNGKANLLTDQNRLWFGWSRDTDLATTPAGGAPGLFLAADQTALELQDPSIGSQFFVNATGKGENRWLNDFGYAELAEAQASGLEMQPQFSRINTDNPDLSAFQAAGGKMVMYQGLSDEYIHPQGAINYYERVLAAKDGADTVQQFFRFYLVPGFTHSGRQEGLPTTPVPQSALGRDDMFAALQDWVENDTTPETLQLQSLDQTTSLPVCVYPQALSYAGEGSPRTASSYSCS